MRTLLILFSSLDHELVEPSWNTSIPVMSNHPLFGCAKSLPIQETEVRERSSGRNATIIDVMT